MVPQFTCRTVCVKATDTDVLSPAFDNLAIQILIVSIIETSSITAHTAATIPPTSNKSEQKSHKIFHIAINNSKNSLNTGLLYLPCVGVRQSEPFLFPAHKVPYPIYMRGAKRYRRLVAQARSGSTITAMSPSRWPLTITALLSVQPLSGAHL